jgi:hypothetical protein
MTPMQMMMSDNDAGSGDMNGGGGGGNSEWQSSYCFEKVWTLVLGQTP